MSDSEPTLELRVHRGGNAVLTERLTRELYAELNEFEDVVMRYAPPAPPGENSKSAVADAVTLWAFLSTAATVTGTVLVQAIKTWAEAKRCTVRLTIGDAEIELPQGLDDAQERVIVKLLEERRS
ncbi:hypothetical protein [Amycolatopsis sp. WAC 01416]|uniref:effector-associated constant component EACC1 n=1 Tax=Amycolatopsis sp. WAC 01416 TaxID=2203196 RepID=UPI0013157C10|nr:hypothetical protein [Amycolatopsis sp. WAC 01416]